VLSDAPVAAQDAAALMVSELATNCVKHAHSDFELTVESEAGGIRVEVRDASSGQPTLRSAAPHELSGRGLRIIESMADEWGVTPAAPGKTVWFTLPRDRPAVG
jgi:anti-sigma regulatory factor (Ser/Thr protein kinase)